MNRIKFDKYLREHQDIVHDPYLANTLSMPSKSYLSYLSSVTEAVRLAKLKYNFILRITYRLLRKCEKNKTADKQTDFAEMQ